MSYCRFSTDSFKCDLYIYADVSGGWTMHIAGSRYVNPPEQPSLGDLLDPKKAKGWATRHTKASEALRKCSLEPIFHPAAGKSENYGDLESLRDRMLVLRAEGFNFPDYVLEDIASEVAAELHAKPGDSAALDGGLSSGTDETKESK